jgi:hypothetical protein
MRLHEVNLGATAAPSAADIMNAIPGSQSLLTFVKGEVKSAAISAVKPYVLGAYAVGGVGVLLGLGALIVAVARR